LKLPKFHEIYNWVKITRYKTVHINFQL